MIVVDTSAVLAVLLGEPHSDAISAQPVSASEKCMGAPTRLELSTITLARSGTSGLHDLNAWLTEAGIAARSNWSTIRSERTSRRDPSLKKSAHRRIRACVGAASHLGSGPQV